MATGTPSAARRNGLRGPGERPTVVTTIRRLIHRLARPLRFVQKMPQFLRIARRLGGDWKATIRLLSVLILLDIQQVLRVKARRWITVRINVLGAEVSCSVRHITDLGVIWEVFALENYRVAGVDDAQTIVDLGSNIGLSVIYFRLRYPHARIIAVEPDPGSFAALQRNTAGLSGVELVSAAVTSTDGPTVLYSSSVGVLSGMRKVDPAQVPVTVPGRTLDSLASELGLDQVDLLKVDIEGSEFDVFTDSDFLARVNAIAGEVHPVGRAPQSFLGKLHDFDLSLTESPSGEVLFRGRRVRHPAETVAP